MRLQTWRIQGRVFHFGKHGIDLEASRETWPSDSLFAALVSRLVLLEGEAAVEAWLGTPKQPRKPPLVLTSTFPYAGEVRFFPVPRAALRTAGALPQGMRFKDLKRVRFVSEGLYRRLIAGEGLAAVAAEGQVLRLHDGTVWLLRSEARSLPRPAQRAGDGSRRLWTVSKRPRVTVGRRGLESNLFHVGAVHFAPGCGLWFGVQWLEAATAEDHERLRALLADLGDAGLGAERAVGYGRAEILADPDPLELPDPQGGPWTTLSRYWPTPEETPALQAPQAAYEVVQVGGFLHGYALRRRAVRLLKEGAVLGPLPTPPPFGAVVDTRPLKKEAADEEECSASALEAREGRAGAEKEQPKTPLVPHPVWRNGMTVAVGYGGGA